MYKYRLTRKQPIKVHNKDNEINYFMPTLPWNITNFQSVHLYVNDEIVLHYRSRLKQVTSKLLALGKLCSAKSPPSLARRNILNLLLIQRFHYQSINTSKSRKRLRKRVLSGPARLHTRIIHVIWRTVNFP